MKCIDLINELKAPAGCCVDESRTCDTIKSGDPDSGLSKLAVSMFATPEIVKKASEWGAELLIVHEPTYYNHFDTKANDYLPASEKEKLIRETGITIFRFHDYAHFREPDLICEGELKYLGVKGEFKKGKHPATNSFILTEPVSALELAKLAEEKLGIKHVRIAGNPRAEGKRISCSFGTPGHLEEVLAENDFVLTGEICEWQLGEIARDYGQLGYNKAVLVMGHIGSERAGMMHVADILSEKHPDIEVKYFECGEVYSYTDDFEQ